MRLRRRAGYAPAGAAPVPLCRGALTDASFSLSALTRGHRTHDTAPPPRRLRRRLSPPAEPYRWTQPRGPRLSPRVGYAVLDRPLTRPVTLTPSTGAAPPLASARRRFWSSHKAKIGLASPASVIYIIGRKAYPLQAGETRKRGHPCDPSFRGVLTPCDRSQGWQFFYVSPGRHGRKLHSLTLVAACCGANQKRA